MTRTIQQRTVDLSGYPDLVVIYLGMQVRALRGVPTLLGFVRPIRRSAEAQPDGLLLHEWLTYSLFPLHAGMRQYWRDFDSLERWARTSDAHSGWWRAFVQDHKGTAFWHETYFKRGGMEAIYANPTEPENRRSPAPFTGPRQGFYAFAPVVAPQGSMTPARRRLRLEGDELAEAPVRRTPGP